ncbi:uncharacterized protein LACBIDRAFT_329557 [Laccaria bicolor S238N-H82]|uniref:Predicted protein n=1 Tax=Laccaria bicolor (strain S238N-H82 / ATCC MYA-4686) TaxID=486041 RepID=B0DIE6_LACBS|nr:uncharacterized protein LACBIDRAFT_329557 [Laccaria bicolor S238N-H82]EDR05551.1 predicted protein [Laccaria bicolor S238N-H82]|eukprot:XP_001883655.1 predicted protein [Laccaria bicolor S238N-H82]
MPRGHSKGGAGFESAIWGWWDIFQDNPARTNEKAVRHCGLLTTDYADHLSCVGLDHGINNWNLPIYGCMHNHVGPAEYLVTAHCSLMGVDPRSTHSCLLLPSWLQLCEKFRVNTSQSMSGSNCLMCPTTTPNDNNADPDSYSCKLHIYMGPRKP